MYQIHIKGDEKQLENDFDQLGSRSVHSEINMIQDSAKETSKDDRSKAEKQLSALKNTLKDMIQINRKATTSVQAGLTGFYKEISKSIKRN